MLTGQQRRHRTTERVGDGAEHLALGDGHFPVRRHGGDAGAEDLAAEPRRRLDEPVEGPIQRVQVAIAPRQQGGRTPVSALGQMADGTIFVAVWNF